MNKVSSLSLLIILGFFAINFIISLFLVRNRFDSQQRGTNFRQVKEELKTTVVPRHDFINILMITLKNPGLVNKGEYELEILDENENVIRKMNFSGFNVGDPSDLKFQFSPIEDSNGRKLMVVLRGKVPSGDPIFIDSNENGEIAYRLYYRSTNKMATLTGLTSEWKEKFLNNLIFFISWFIFLTILVWLGIKNEKT